MRSRKLLILELETEEAAVGTLLRTLKTTDWKITVLGSDLFLSKLYDLMDGVPINALVLNSTEKLSGFNWHLFDLVLLPNPKFMPSEYARVFLKSIGNVQFGIGVFDSHDLENNHSAINRCYDKNGASLLSSCSFIYISDLDFINLNNALVKQVTARKKAALVIPFKYPEVIEPSKLCDSVHIVISGKVQAKRRRYLFAILSVVLAAQKSSRPVCLYLNGGASGIYGLFIFYLSQLLNKLLPRFSITSYKERVSQDIYCDNLRNGHINLLPLTSLYNDGKDTGAFYDSMQYNMVTICPSSYLQSIGTIHGAVSLGYRSMVDLIRIVRTVISQLEDRIADSYSKTADYKGLDFRGYLLNELNKLSTTR
jgi:hypothetical protein